MLIKEFNKFKNTIKNIKDKKINAKFENYQIFNFVDVNVNLFGMYINKIIKNNFNYKQNEIQNLMKYVEKKYNDLKKIYKNVEDSYKNFYNNINNNII